MEMQEKMENISHQNGGADVLERKVNLNLYVSNVENIEVVMNESLIYVPRDEYDLKMEDLDESISNLNKSVANKADKKKTFKFTVDTEWTGEQAPYTKTIQVQGLSETDIPVLDIIWGDTVEQREKEADAYNKIRKIECKKDTVILTCDSDKPTETLNLRIEVMY